MDVPGSTSSCVTYPLTDRISPEVITRPLTRNSPPTRCPTLGLPASMSIKVVFPAPDGPRIAKRSARACVTWVTWWRFGMRWLLGGASRLRLCALELRSLV